MIKKCTFGLLWAISCEPGGPGGEREKLNEIWGGPLKGGPAEGSLPTGGPARRRSLRRKKGTRTQKKKRQHTEKKGHCQFRVQRGFQRHSQEGKRVGFGAGECEESCGRVARILRGFRVGVENFAFWCILWVGAVRSGGEVCGGEFPPQVEVETRCLPRVPTSSPLNLLPSLSS